MITQVLGLHYIFGAFVAGILMPPELRQPLLDRLQAATAGLLMPFFFMLTGLRTLIDLGSSGFVDILMRKNQTRDCNCLRRSQQRKFERYRSAKLSREFARNRRRK